MGDLGRELHGEEGHAVDIRIEPHPTGRARDPHSLRQRNGVQALAQDSRSCAEAGRCEPGRLGEHVVQTTKQARILGQRARDLGGASGVRRHDVAVEASLPDRGQQCSQACRIERLGSDLVLGAAEPQGELGDCRPLGELDTLARRHAQFRIDEDLGRAPCLVEHVGDSGPLFGRGLIRPAQRDFGARGRVLDAHRRPPLIDLPEDLHATTSHDATDIPAAPRNVL